MTSEFFYLSRKRLLNISIFKLFHILLQWYNWPSCIYTTKSSATNWQQRNISRFLAHWCLSTLQLYKKIFRAKVLQAIQDCFILFSWVSGALLMFFTNRKCYFGRKIQWKIRKFLIRSRTTGPFDYLTGKTGGHNWNCVNWKYKTALKAFINWILWQRKQLECIPCYFVISNIFVQL